MNTRDIKILLDRYYEGETTLEEEKILRDFFNGDEVPVDLAEHKPLFVWTSEERTSETEMTIHLPEEEGKVISLFRKRPALYWITGIAATFLLLAGYFSLLQPDRNNRLKQEENRMAYEQTKDALMLLSANLNTGLDQVQKLGTFQKGIQQMQNFSTFYKYQTLIINPDVKDHPKNSIQ
jgi:hypothetical protein